MTNMLVAVKDCASYYSPVPNFCLPPRFRSNRVEVSKAPGPAVQFIDKWIGSKNAIRVGLFTYAAFTCFNIYGLSEVPSDFKAAKESNNMSSRDVISGIFINLMVSTVIPLGNVWAYDSVAKVIKGIIYKLASIIHRDNHHVPQVVHPSKRYRCLSPSSLNAVVLMWVIFSAYTLYVKVSQDGITKGTDLFDFPTQVGIGGILGKLTAFLFDFPNLLLWKFKKD